MAFIQWYTKISYSSLDAFVNMNLVKVLEKLFFSTIKVSSNFSFKYFINNIWQQKDDILVLFLSSQSNYVKFQLTVHVFEKMACWSSFYFFFRFIWLAVYFPIKWGNMNEWECLNTLTSSSMKQIYFANKLELLLQMGREGA